MIPNESACYVIRSNSRMNNVLAHIMKSDLAHFLFRNIIDKVMHKTKNYKKISQNDQII